MASGDFTHRQVTVDDSAEVPLFNGAAVASYWIVNLGVDEVYLGPTGVSVTDYPLASSDDPLTSGMGPFTHGKLPMTRGEIYAICDTGESADIRVLMVLR